MELSDSKQKLFRQIRLKLGEPVRKVELTDEQLCAALEWGTQEYSSCVLMYMMENNWASLYGRDLNTTDLAFAFSARPLDILQDYSYYFSKEVGLQQRGPFELKKDWFKLEIGRQCYEIPSGRAIDKVMWIQPSVVDESLWASYGGFSTSFGGGVMGQLGMGTAAVFGGVGTAGGMGVGVWALPAYDVALMSADLSYKRSLIKSDITYKVTAGPNGTHIVHLTPVPGSPFSFRPGGNGVLSLHNCVCWYTYYDVTADNIDECRRLNRNLLMTPDQVPLDSMDYDYMNEPTQAIVRQLAFGEAAETLALILGKFSGNINMISSPLQIDYNMYMSLGQKEKDNARKVLEERMQRLSPFEIMKKQAELMNNMLEIKKGVPLASYIKII